MDPIGCDNLPADPPTPPPGLLEDLIVLGRALQRLFSAQLHLLAAELGLVRAAVPWLVAAILIVIVTAVGLGLTVLALLGWQLAQWLGSWAWALAVLAVVELMVLAGAVILLRRCLRAMSLPETRAEWKAIKRDMLHRPAASELPRSEPAP